MASTVSFLLLEIYFVTHFTSWISAGFPPTFDLLLYSRTGGGECPPRHRYRHQHFSSPPSRHRWQQFSSPPSRQFRRCLLQCRNWSGSSKATGDTMRLYARPVSRREGFANPRRTRWLVRGASVCAASHWRGKIATHYAKWLATWLARAAICLSFRPRRQDYTRLQWKARHAAHGQQVRRYPLSCHATTDPLSCRGAGAKLRKLTQSFYERLQDPRFYGVDPDKLFRVKVKCKFWHITDVADGLFRWETGIRHLIRHGHGHGRNGGGDGIYGADSDGNCNVPLDGCESEGTFNGCESESE